MVESFQKFINKNKVYVLGAFILLNLLVSFKGRGGIILLSNVFYGMSTLALVALTILDWKNQKDKKSFGNLWLLLFLAFFLISFLFAANKGYGLSELLLYSSSASLFFYTANTSFKIEHIEKLKKCLVSIALLTILFGFYVYLSYPYDRLSSFFYNFEDKFIGYPNALADFLLISFPLILLIKNKYSKYLAGLLFASALILTFSRGAYLAFIAELIIILWIYRKETKFFKKLAIASIVGILSVTFSLAITDLKNDEDILEEKITLEADEKASSVNERLEFFQGSIEIIKDYPLFGIGSDGFQFVYPRYQKTAFATSNHPHNIFLKIGLENGLPAAIFLALFFLSIFIAGIRSEKLESKLLAVGLLGLLSHNLIDYNLNFVPNILLLFLFCGFIANQNSQSLKTHKSAAIVIILSILIATLSIHEGYLNYYFQQGRSAINEREYTKAIELLEKSNSMIFPRRLYSSLAEAYKADNQNIKAIKMADLARILNQDDAHAHNFFGELVGDKQAFEAAIQKDPKNFLRFHFNLLMAEENLSPEQEEKYEEILENYLHVLKNNQHNTILTDNPKFAINIAQLIGKVKLQEELEKAKNLEEKKFTHKFNFNFTNL